MSGEPNPKYQLHEAAREGKTSIVESLLNVDPKSALLKDEDDRLPLHWACSHNHLQIVELLLDKTAPLPKFDIDVQDNSGWTSLMIASSIKDGDPIVDLLLARGADPNMTTTSGQTALHFVASKGHLDVARRLVGVGKASARVKDGRGQFALHRAAAVGSVPMCRILLGARSPVNAGDMDGMTALHQAIIEGHGDTAVFLLQSGAEFDRLDRDGKTALELAPDDKVRLYIRQAAEREGIELP